MRTFLGLIALAVVLAATVGGVAFYAAPRDFQTEIAQLAPRDGPTVYLVYALDTEALRRTELETAAERISQALRSADPPIRFSGLGVSGDAARVRLVDRGDLVRSRMALAAAANGWDATDTLAFVEHGDGLIEARLPFVVMRDATRLAVARSVQVLSRRLNPTGTLPITVTAIGEDGILVVARGESDAGRLRGSIGGTGLLTFNLVRETDADDLAAGRIPAGAFLAQPYVAGAGAVVVERRPRFTGERIVGAGVSRDQASGGRALRVLLDAEGARQFCSVTQANIGARFAVLLDDQVVTAPRIDAPVCDGVAQIAGHFNEDEANRLALLLRAGALPAPLVLVEEGWRAAR